MNVEIRKAIKEDAEAVCGVMHQSITELCLADHKGDQPVIDHWLQHKTVNEVQKWLLAPHAEAYVAVDQGEVVSIGIVTPASHILLCYVAPRVLYQGVGKKLLETMVVYIISQGTDKIYLESTATAKPFYERNGFKVSGAPTLCDGIVSYPMERKLCLKVQPGTKFKLRQQS